MTCLPQSLEQNTFLWGFDPEQNGRHSEGCSPSPPLPQGHWRIQMLVDCSQEASPQLPCHKLPLLMFLSGIPLNTNIRCLVLCTENLPWATLAHFDAASECYKRGLDPNCSTSGPEDKQKLGFGSCFGDCQMQKLNAVPTSKRYWHWTLASDIYITDTFPCNFTLLSQLCQRFCLSLKNDTI